MLGCLWWCCSVVFQFSSRSNEQYMTVSSPVSRVCVATATLKHKARPLLLNEMAVPSWLLDLRLSPLRWPWCSSQVPCMPVLGPVVSRNAREGICRCALLSLACMLAFRCVFISGNFHWYALFCAVWGAGRNVFVLPCDVATQCSWA